MIKLGSKLYSILCLKYQLFDTSVSLLAIGIGIGNLELHHLQVGGYNANLSHLKRLMCSRKSLPLFEYLVLWVLNCFHYVVWRKKELIQHGDISFISFTIAAFNACQLYWIVLFCAEHPIHVHPAIGASGHVANNVKVLPNHSFTRLNKNKIWLGIDYF